MTVKNNLIVVTLSLSMVFPVTGYTNAMPSMMHRNLSMDLPTVDTSCHRVHKSTHKHRKHSRINKVRRTKKNVSLSCSSKYNRHSSSFIGTASWYGPGFHGRRTASGERFNQYDLTAAHRSIPLGTRVRVTNLETDESVIVRINDRGPFVRGRVIDLSKGAAKAIGMTGTTKVEIAMVD
jgi:rare lipoprotein A (peptidoglycan hydrolase)